MSYNVFKKFSNIPVIRDLSGAVRTSRPGDVGKASGRRWLLNWASEEE